MNDLMLDVVAQNIERLNEFDIESLPAEQRPVHAQRKEIEKRLLAQLVREYNEAVEASNEWTNLPEASEPE